MPKIEMDKNAFVYPMPMVLVGTLVEDRANFLAVAWVTRVNFRPPMIAIALGKNKYSGGGIKTFRAFSINVPGVGLMEKVDYCGLVSGKQIDKSTLFQVIPGKETGAPLIEECPVCLECRLVEVLDLPSNEVFIGEIVGALANPDCCSDGVPDIQKIQPFTLTMPDNQYWRVGEKAGKAWSIGKDFR